MSGPQVVIEVWSSGSQAHPGYTGMSGCKSSVWVRQVVAGVPGEWVKSERQSLRKTADAMLKAVSS